MEMSSDGRGASVQLTFWLESDGSIRLVVPGAPQPTIRIKNDPLRPSGHPRLYSYLAQYLREEEGSHTDQ